MKWPSEIREAVRADHVVVRREAAKVVEVLSKLPTDAVVPTDTDVLVEGLLQLVLDHLEREEAQVLPEVQSGDAWSAERSKLLLDHHEAERQTIADIRRKMAAHDPGTIPAILAWIDEVKAESEREDAELLTPEVMSDSIVRVGEDG